MDEMIKETTGDPKETEVTEPKSDKLTVLKAKHEKAAAAAQKAAEKARRIQDEINAEEQKRRDKEIKQLDSICKSMKIALPDVICLIKLISENDLTVNDVAELIGTK